MNKKLVLINAALLFSIVLVACGTFISPTPAQNQQGGVYEISARLQATEAPPPVPLPTIVINPTPGQGGSFFPTDPVTLLLYVLVGAIIFIALIAVLRK